MRHRFLTLLLLSCSVAIACQQRADWSADAWPTVDADERDGADASPPSDADVEVDADVPSSDADAEDEPPPLPEPYRPCEVGTCWDTSATLTRCHSTSIDEDFSSGRYNVHDYGTTLYAEGDITVRLVRTGGSWQPAIIVAESDGDVLSDGSIGLVDAEIDVSIVSDGTTGDQAALSIRTETDRAVSIFVTGWSVIEGGFVDFLPTDATYTLTVTHTCDDPPVECVVNGHTVAEPACGWLNHIGRTVVPQLLGTRDERLDDASVVAWWSLKEGVLYLENPIVYSNCHFSTGDARIGPLEVCASGQPWQVGLAAVQVYNYSLSAIEATTTALFPGQTIEEVLAATAAEAGVDAATADAIVASTDNLRRSWLLRTSAVGFTHQVGTVADECIERRLDWCFGTGWDTSRWFAPDYDGAMTSIADIRAILDALAP